MSDEEYIQLTDHYQAAIVLLGGRDFNQHDFDTFPEYAEAVGVCHVNWAAEVLHPPADLVNLWSNLGQPSLEPPQDLWPRLAAVLMLFVRLRHVVREPVTIRHGYRSPAWNAAVKGAPGSDHREACALDLVFKGNGARLVALRELQFIWRAQLLALSIGSVPHGHRGRKLHVGVGASRTLRGKQRQWTYPPGATVW